MVMVLDRKTLIPSLETRPYHQLVSLGCNLWSLVIYKCCKLERLPNGWQSLTCLEELDIGNCQKLVSFPEVGFPSNLRRLTHHYCDGLKYLYDVMMLNTSNNLYLLESLDIRGCSSLICFPNWQLSITLKTLRVDNCKSMSSLLERIMMHCHSIPSNNTMGFCSP